MHKITQLQILKILYERKPLQNVKYVKSGVDTVIVSQPLQTFNKLISTDTLYNDETIYVTTKIPQYTVNCFYDIEGYNAYGAKIKIRYFALIKINENIFIH